MLPMGKLLLPQSFLALPELLFSMHQLLLLVAIPVSQYTSLSLTPSAGRSTYGKEVYFIGFVQSVWTDLDDTDEVDKIPLRFSSIGNTGSQLAYQNSPLKTELLSFELEIEFKRVISFLFLKVSHTKQTNLYS